MSTQVSKIASLLLQVSLLVACGSDPAAPTPTAVPATVTLTISGSTSTAVVLKFLAEAYRSQRKDLAFDFPVGSGSGGGIKGVQQGLLDLAALGRLPTDAEAATGVAAITFATDKVAVATSPNVTVNRLSSQQVKDIFQGKISNWSAVGGPDQPINLFVRDEEDISTLVLRKGLFGDSPFKPGAVVLTSESDMVNALANLTGAIGYLSYSGLRL